VAIAEWEEVAGEERNIVDAVVAVKVEALSTVEVGAKDESEEEVVLRWE
jgi:hypothetical protein